MLVLAVVSILYGSVMAFSQDEARLVVGYSSIAQLGFITLGIFSLTRRAPRERVIQMVNHGSSWPRCSSSIAALARARRRLGAALADGRDRVRAPVLAALFLIVALANLAMPGSANFVGELYILFGAFEAKLACGLVASAGVALAAVYMIRLYQRAMHNRVGPAVESREICVLELGRARAARGRDPGARRVPAGRAGADAEKAAVRRRC